MPFLIAFVVAFFIFYVLAKTIFKPIGYAVGFSVSFVLTRTVRWMTTSATKLTLVCSAVLVGFLAFA